MSPDAAFADVPASPRGHAQLAATAAVHVLVGHVTRWTSELELVMAGHPFLEGYLGAARERLPTDLDAEQQLEWWGDALSAVEARATTRMPIAGLVDVGLDRRAQLAVVLAGLVEEDARFRLLHAHLQGTTAPCRPTLGTLGAVVGVDPWSLRELHRVGAVDLEPDTPTGAGARVAVPAPLWALLRGDGPRTFGAARLLCADEPAVLDDVVLDGTTRRRVDAALAQLRDGELRTVVVAGRPGSGRRRVLAAMLAAVGRAALAVAGGTLDEDGWRRLAAIAAAAGAAPLVELELGPAERHSLAPLPGWAGPMGVVTGRHGALDLAGDGVRIDLRAPGPDDRRRCWRAALVDVDVAPGAVDAVAERVRLPVERIRTAAAAAVRATVLDRRDRVEAHDLAAGVRTLERAQLDTLTQHLAPVDGWDRIVVEPTTAELLGALERRCRHRERVAGGVGRGFEGTSTCGVRALFAGASGTGKTLAARILAARLGLELHRVDLSAMVDKYIGETEKNLHRVLTAAEELDVVLLVDEGDSLLGRRTEVRSANDRYANLETNYLLQRLEHHDGIVVVTTNAAERVDPAFQRRMDAVVTLRGPGPVERERIWDLHLPDGHAVGAATLRDVAVRAEMTGGQIRNAALDAVLLAADRGGHVGASELRAAVATELAKTGAMSPFALDGLVEDDGPARRFMAGLP